MNRERLATYGKEIRVLESITGHRALGLRRRHNSLLLGGKEDDGMKGSETCAICLNVLEDSDQSVIFPCEGKHKFHGSCICPWLMTNDSCPLCRTKNTARRNPPFAKILCGMDEKVTRIPRLKASCKDLQWNWKN